MLPGTRTDDGSLYIVVGLDPPEPTFMNGILHGRLGAVYCTTQPPERFVNGFGVMNTGHLCIAPGAPIARYNMGFPFTQGGRLITQLNQPVGPGDTYVAGLRVGPLGGLYTTDLTPEPIAAYDAAFDSAFD